jgi:hypothetical protein
MTMATNLRLPEPLKVTRSNVAGNWERFREQWENYEFAAELTEASSAKSSAVFLTCLGGEAYNAYRSMDIPTAADKRHIDNIKCLRDFLPGYSRYYL